MGRHALLTAAIVAISAAATTATAVAHDAPMPLDARHGRLDHQPWVMSHWLPFDEAVASGALGLAPGQLEAYLYDDHHTLAQLAAVRGVPFETLVTQLSAWVDAAAPPAQRAEIQQRIRLTLVSGHLAQHVIGHVFHGSAHAVLLRRASGLPTAELSRRRWGGWSYARLVKAAGGDLGAVEDRIRGRIADRQADGVASGQTPPSQADRMRERQLGLVHCWLVRPSQQLDPAAPFGRKFLRHARGHTAADVPTTIASQRREERAIERGRAGLPPSCWKRPDAFTGVAGPPLLRADLRMLAGLPATDTGRPGSGPSPSPMPDHAGMHH